MINNKVIKVLQHIMLVLSFWYFTSKCDTFLHEANSKGRQRANKEMLAFRDAFFEKKIVQGVDSKNRQMRFYNDRTNYWPYMYRCVSEYHKQVEGGDTIIKQSYDTFYLLSKGNRYIYVIDTTYYR